MTTRKLNKFSRCAAAILGAALILSAPAQEEMDETPVQDQTTEETPQSSDEPSEQPAADSEQATTDSEQPADATAETTPAAAPEAPSNPRRAKTFAEALEAAGDDGVVVFCYGPDWNARSTRMLKSFWETPAAEEAAGNAIMVALPYYDNPTPEQEEESSSISQGIQFPRTLELPLRTAGFHICPDVLMFNKEGTLYANLPGSDYLGDEKGELGLKNMRERIAALRKQVELLRKAESQSGVEKARTLSQTADLGIAAPADLLEQLQEADPSDESGMIRRHTFDSLQFLYNQMDTKDGFLKNDLVIDFKKLQDDCMKVIKDEAIKPIDRQAVYLLLIGQSRREGITGKRLKDLMTACMKLDPQSPYGKIMPSLIETWGNAKSTQTSDDRRAQRQRDKEKAKERKAKEKEMKRAEKNAEVR